MLSRLLQIFTAYKQGRIIRFILTGRLQNSVSSTARIQKERDAMERLWKAREKQLEKVLLNAAHISGSVEGISGADTVNLSLTDEVDYNYLEE